MGRLNYHFLQAARVLTFHAALILLQNTLNTYLDLKGALCLKVGTYLDLEGTLSLKVGTDHGCIGARLAPGAACMRKQ